MVPIFKHLASLLVALSIFPAVFLVSIIIQYAKTSFPPGIDQPFKLRIYQTLVIFFLLLGLILEKLKLCSLLDVLRLLDHGMPSFGDSSVLIQKQQFDGIPVKVYQPKKPASTKRKGLLFFHGGAGTYGSVDSYKKILRHFTKEADAVIVAVGYGLGPENPYPNQYTECLKATQYFMRNADEYQVDASRISVCGDSCGANFATRICQLLVDRTDLPKIQAQILMYPGLQGMDFHLPSYQQNKNSPILWRDLVIYYTCRFLNKNASYLKDVVEGCHVPDDIQKKYRKWVDGDLIPEEFKVRGYTPPDPALRKFKPQVYEEMKQVLEVTFSPLFAEDNVISKLPPACILTCEFDVLRDDGLLYKRRLEENGVPVTWFHAEKSTHALAILFGYGPFSVPSSQWIVDKITDFVKSL